MNNKQIAVIDQQTETGSLLLGTSLAFASLILVPALAVSFGIGPSVTGALRMALMKASNRAISQRPTKTNSNKVASTSLSCR
jgi:hypothetical protein